MDGGAWSIYENREVRARYEIYDRIGSGAYAEVYRGQSRESGAPVALKEVHEQTSSVRELSALQALKGSPNVVQLVDFFWQSPGIILVLEFLPSSLADVIEESEGKGFGDEEVSKWIKMLLSGIASCHFRGILHRDLKPSNLLIGFDGVLKVADFGTSRFLEVKDSNVTLLTALQSVVEDVPEETGAGSQKIAGKKPSHSEAGAGAGFLEGSRASFGKFQQLDFRSTGKSLEHFNSKKSDIDIECWLDAGTTAGCSSRFPDDFQPPAMHTSSSYGKLEVDEDAISFGTEASPRISDDEDYYGDATESRGHMTDDLDNDGELTGCIGTRWYRAPEVLYGSTRYGFGSDLWGVGCIFGELIQGNPLFPGASDIDQLSRVVRVLGVPTPETWPSITELPDYDKICFNDDRPPVTVEKLVSKASKQALELLVKFLVYAPESRISAQEALKHQYFTAATPQLQKDKQAVDAWLSGKA